MLAVTRAIFMALQAILLALFLNLVTTDQVTLAICSAIGYLTSLGMFFYCHERRGVCS